LRIEVKAGPAAIGAEEPEPPAVPEVRGDDHADSFGGGLRLAVVVDENGVDATRILTGGEHLASNRVRIEPAAVIGDVPALAGAAVGVGSHRIPSFPTGGNPPRRPMIPGHSMGLPGFNRLRSGDPARR